jgi:histidyl-tRNA synthetase
LTKLGIEYVVDADMVRGLDYYNHTIFEIMSADPVFGGGYTTILGGGRYNGLVEELGGPETPGVGFAMGVERLMLLMQGKQNAAALPAYIVAIGDAATAQALELAQAIRAQGFAVDMDYLGRKHKAQFKSANKAGARLVLTLGDSELEAGTVEVKDMATGEQTSVAQTVVKTQFATLYQETVED